jgi:hypothetical protein
MNVRSQLLVSGVALCLCACASSVTSPDQFRAAEPVAVQVCSTKSVAESGQALADAWGRCWVKRHHNQSIASIIQGPSPFYVTIDELPERGTVALVQQSANFGTTNIVLLADLRHTNRCNTEVSVRGARVPWRGYAEHTKVWLENPFDKGPGAACL